MTYWLLIQYPKTQDDKFHWMPDTEEQVIRAFYENDWDTGVTLGATYNEKDQTPEVNPNKSVVVFKDGARIEYNREARHLLINVKGSVTIKAIGNIVIQGARIDLTP